MTTLNAKANTAYHDLVAAVERENPGDVWAGFEHERDAFEAGYEAAHPVVDREGLSKDAVLAEIDATQRELTDIMNVDGPLRDRVRREQGMDGIQRAVHKVIALRQRLADLPVEPAPQPINQAELADVLREAFTADPEGATWQQAAEAVADWINGDAS